jgi:L-rhamnose mutarotase
MLRKGFAMKLLPGKEAEYKKRHDAIWNELVRELQDAGVRDYAIYLDRRTLTLYAFQQLTEHNTESSLAMKPIVQKWWAFMADIMETNADNSPVCYDLEEMFYLD